MFRTAILVAAISVAAATQGQAAHHVKSATAEIINAQGDVIGQAKATQGPNGVLLHVRVTNLPPGKHGLHLHSHGVCEAGEGFKTAQGHVGKVEGAHGLLNPEGPEPGDLPNLYVGQDGVGEMEAFTNLVSLEGDGNTLLDADGSTFIIHEAGDDHISQPIGGAGGRIACGILIAD